mmetsp:Transcript_19670/g.39118  ORF Transcript_19670/g.39118 Transcript_19670/m.39118 type:complete len:260 (-) Transcript_19670:1266-2045(-)
MCQDDTSTTSEASAQHQHTAQEQQTPIISVQACSSKIVVHARIFLAPLHVFPLHQILDPSLDVAPAQSHREHAQHLRHQVLVRHRPARFHDPDDARVHLVLAVPVHRLVGAIGFGRDQLGLPVDGLHHDARGVVFVVHVQGETVGVRHLLLLGLGVPEQELLGVQALQGPLQLVAFVHAGGFRELGQGEAGRSVVFGVVLEAHEDLGLVLRHQQLVGLAAEGRLEGHLTETILPGYAAALVFFCVKVLELPPVLVDPLR